MKIIVGTRVYDTRSWSYFRNFTSFSVINEIGIFDPCLERKRHSKLHFTCLFEEIIRTQHFLDFLNQSKR